MNLFLCFRDKNKCMSENKSYIQCSINGVCSIDNAISSLREVVLLYIKNFASYILKLKEFGITNDIIKDDVINILFGIFINLNYSEKEYSDIISKIDKYTIQSKFLYEKYCKDNNIKIQTINKKLKRSVNILEAIKNGEKSFLKKYKALSDEQKNTYEIIYLLCRSIIIRYVELKRLGVEYVDAYYSVLEIFNSCELNGFCFDNVQKIFIDCINVYHELMKLIYATQKNLYGNIQKTNVDMSTQEGKSILVSGSDMNALQRILDLTENSNINIYTHGFNMLVAHTLPEFSKYKNLKGHFSTEKHNYISDFSTFKGPILMSRVYMENIDFLYRGRLFSQDPYVSRGIEKIIDDDYTPLIEAAKNVAGFKKYHRRNTISAGFDEKEILAYTDDILNKLKDGELNQLYVIGICNCEQNNKYYETLLNNLPEKSFAISLSYNKSAENIYHINSLYDGRLFLKIFRNIAEYKDKNISVFMTREGRYTVANLLLLWNFGFRHIFSENFQDHIIASNTKQILETRFNIHFIKDPLLDIEKSKC